MLRRRKDKRDEIIAMILGREEDEEDEDETITVLICR